MTRSVSRIALAAIGSCALAALLIARCAHDAKPSRSSGAAATGARGGHAPAGAPRAPSVGWVDGDRAAALESRLAAATTVIAVPASPPPSGTSLPPLPGPLPPEVERGRTAALEQWKRQVQQQLDTCAPRPAAGTREVALDVMFLPGPRTSGEPRQPLEASVVSIDPSALRRLWEDLDPDVVQRCVDQIRGIPLEVALSAEALSHQFPSSAERVLVRL